MSTSVTGPIVVTGATGHLGRLVVESLLRRGVPAGSIIATGRRTEVLKDLADRGVVVRRADFTDPASLTAAFAGADKVLLVSSTELGQRAAQHANAIDAAAAAGVSLIAYTSILRADTSTMLIAAEHLETERLLEKSGVPFVLLRNGWYIENYTHQLDNYRAYGIAGSAGAGRVSAATRADYADAAAVVLMNDGQAGAIHELGGAAFDMAELAQAVSVSLGQQVSYANLPFEQYEEVLKGAGLPAPLAKVLADADRGAANGELFVDPAVLEGLLGRPAVTLAEALRA